VVQLARDVVAEEEILGDERRGFRFCGGLRFLHVGGKNSPSRLSSQQQISFSFADAPRFCFTRAMKSFFTSLLLAATVHAAEPIPL
jgi:hypothetical protein